MRSLWAPFWIVGVWLVLAWSQLPKQAPSHSPARIEEVRIGMLQALEDLVQRERFYRIRSGSFTTVPGRLDFEVPAAIRGAVEVRVTSADREHLVAEAYSEGDPSGGRTVDRVWMDEQFRVQANFPIQGLRWVVLQGASGAAAASDWGAGAAIPDLEVEPVNSTAASDFVPE